MAARHDTSHRAFRGSQCQVQLYVNATERRSSFDEEILAALPTLTAKRVFTLDWRSPLREPLFDDDHPFHEYRDGKLFRAIGQPGLLAAWKAYWPSRSQTWDAVAVALDKAGESLGPVLVEAKSYPAEFRDVGGGTAAEDSRRDLIALRLAETRQWLGVDENVSVAERWLGDYYQSANRFATLRFFRAFTVNNWKEQPTDAWLVNVYFVDDQSHVDAKRATSRAVWDTKIAEAEEELGLAEKPVPHSGRVFLKAGNYEELVAATGG